MKTIEILVGIPCSGKSYYVSHKSLFYTLFCKVYNIKLISRDMIREDNNLNQYTKKSENIVTSIYNKQLEKAICNDNINFIILDNTHCKEKYIDEIIKKYSEYNIEIKFFDIPLWKAHYRNVIRYFTTDKWIPIKIMNNMYKNYKKIDKTKYEKYIHM